jgi:phage FluMu protein Com
MGRERREIKCPWCDGVIPLADVKVRRYKNDYGNVVERRCPKCNKVLAAYLEEERDFLPGIRTF